MFFWLCLCLVEALSMELVTSKEIAKVIGTDKFGFIGTFMGWILLRLLRISEINKIYNKHKDKKDLLFLNGILDEFQINDQNYSRFALF